MGENVHVVGFTLSLLFPWRRVRGSKSFGAVCVGVRTSTSGGVIPLRSTKRGNL